jgi:hypothetical protein
MPRPALVDFRGGGGERDVQDVDGTRRGERRHRVDRVGGVDRERGERQLVELIGPAAERLRLPPDLRGRAEELDQDGNLGAQHLGNDRGHDVVDRTQRVALRHVHFLGERGDEDDRRVGGPLPIADERSGLEAVHPGHPHVEQDDGEVLPEQPPQRLTARLRGHDVDVERQQDRLQRDELVRVVVDDQHGRAFDRGVGEASHASAAEPEA